MHDSSETVPSPPPGDVAEFHPAGAPSWKRRLLWTGSAVLLIALLLLAPPLINANRYRGQIAESMSKSLGRSVHLDNVSLHLLPVPGFTLQNLVVSEDPAFGAEPTIRANTVEATLRVSSLWHRPVEFSTVRFVEPSVNLVRDAQGRWNLADVLLNASHVESAPTAQRKAGPKPRFPYIEATGGRVNVKFGMEKLPFSLTDADFALWLPSPQQWRVRLIGSPARTDTDITDPGRIRIEGELRHAATVGQVPVDFRASWHDAPLGEASKMLTGEDRGWRGSMNLDATLTGTLGGAQLASKLTLGGLRRAEFFPHQPLDLQVTCGAGFMLHPATLSDVQCSLPDDAPTPLALRADTVHLQDPRNTQATLKADAVPVRWALLWAGLFSARVPAVPEATGTLDLDLSRGTGLPAAPAIVPVAHRGSKRKRVANVPRPTLPAGQTAWTGSVRLTLLSGTQPAAGKTASTNVLVWDVAPPVVSGAGPSFRLAATPVTLGPDATVTLSGSIAANGYQISVAGNAPPAALLQPARYLPQLGDGLEAVLPNPPTETAPRHVQFTCTRSWTSAQTCSEEDTSPALAR